MPFVAHSAQKAFPTPRKLISLFVDDIKAIPKYVKETDSAYLWAIGLGTAVGIYYDQKLIDATQAQAKRWGLKQNDNTKPQFSIFGYAARFPTDTESSMYFLGDGWIHLGFVAGYGLHGALTSNVRSINIAGQLVEGLGVTAFVTQVIKHVTGRESPFATKTKGGVWRPFPDQVKYHKNVPKYDAFPSGHVATAMTTTTIFVKNFPRYRTAIKVVGYTLTSILAFGMMNLGVHWFGDYPLALGIGYMAGDMAFQHSKELRGGLPADQQSGFVPLVSDRMVGISYFF